MEKYSRFFIIASIIYLVVGTLLGTMMASALLSPGFRFVHIHLNLFGFMAMVVFGVAYHILPRFMGKMVKRPWLIPLHFYASNTGLVGMMLSYLAGGYIDPDNRTATILFEAFSGLAFLGVLIFAVNIIPVLTVAKRKEPAAKPAPRPPAGPKKSGPVITGDMKIGEILEKKPETLNLLIAAGFKGLDNPQTRKAFGEKLVLKTACQIRSIDLDGLLDKLNGPISAEEVKKPTGPEAAAAPPKRELSLRKGDLVTLKTPVGEMIQVYPETKKVLEDNYGGECFTCPGMAIETVEQTAHMHNKKPEDILDQINSIVREVLEK